MIENEGVRSDEALNCLLCGEKGVTLYSDLRDCLFRAPGKWGLKQCPKCQLVWLNPLPIPEDIGNLYLHTSRIRCLIPEKDRCKVYART